MKAHQFPVPHYLQTLPGLLQFATKRFAKKKCLTRLKPQSIDQLSYTFIDFFRMAALLSEAFNNNNALDIKRSDKIAILAPPCPEVAVIMMAAAVYNLNVLIINPDLSQTEIDIIYAKNLDIKATFVTAALRGKAHNELIFLDDDQDTRKFTSAQPEFKPPKKMLF